jgi:small multidrug resistance family-3 protein
MLAKDLPLALMIYSAAAFFEIAGSFAIWSVTRLNRSALWLIPGIAALVLFAWLLTRTDLNAAGRAYAAYGGIYIIASLVWLWQVEGQLPTWWDISGATLCVAGAVTILIGTRFTT